MRKVPERTVSDGVRAGILGLIVLAAAIRPAVSAPWDFGTVLDLGIIYTDNLRLEPEGSEEDEIVYSIAPTFTLSTEGDRLTADLRYRPEAYIYDTAPESDSIFHVVDASATGALIRDALFVSASVTNTQSIVTPNERVPTSNLPITGNRTDSRVIQVRPYWQQNLGFADVLLDASYTDTKYEPLDSTDESALQNNTERSGSFNLNNHSRQQGFAWGTDYTYRRVEYEASVPWDYQRASVNLGYWANGTMRIFASGGAETAFDNYFEPNLDDDFWEIGFQYKPNQRLDLEAAVGERGYGESYRGSLAYELRRGQTTLTYTEQPSTRAGLRPGPRPLTDTDNLDDLLNQPGSSDRFIRKRGEWSTTVELAKSDVSLRIFFEDRTQRTSDTGDALGDEELKGAAFRWNWRLGVKSAVGLSVDYSQRTTDETDAALNRYQLDYSYDLTERLGIIAAVQRSDDEGRTINGTGYVETQYRLTLRAEF